VNHLPSEAAGSRRLAVAGRPRLVECKFDQPGGRSVRHAGGSQRAQTQSHADRREATHTGYQNGSQQSRAYLKTVGMAGFEPATSCSQISSAQSPDVALSRPACRSPGVTVAGRRLASSEGCARWLPLWLPPSPPGTWLLPGEQKIEFRRRSGAGVTARLRSGRRPGHAVAQIDLFGAGAWEGRLTRRWCAAMWPAVRHGSSGGAAMGAR
jgi:hypothetical protein